MWRKTLENPKNMYKYEQNMLKKRNIYIPVYMSYMLILYATNFRNLCDMCS